MLTVDVAPMVRLRGGQRVTVFLTDRGFTYAEARSFAQSGKVVQIKDRTLQRLCEALDCLPNDLFGWRGADTDALAVLNTRRLRPIDDLLKGKDAEELKQFWARARALAEGQQPRPKVKGGVLRPDLRQLIALHTTRPAHLELMRRGLTEMETRTLLGDDRSAMRLTLMTRLCRSFACLPNDLYGFEGPEDHVLNALKRDRLPNLSQLSDEVLRKLGEPD